MVQAAAVRHSDPHGISVAFAVRATRAMRLGAVVRVMVAVMEAAEMAVVKVREAMVAWMVATWVEARLEVV